MKNDDRIKQIQKLLDVAEGNLHSARNLLLDITGGKPQQDKASHIDLTQDLSSAEGKVIEGVFDGEQMVATDDKKYPVPANYASKSKLVEGDILKLTIAEDGSLMYKQIKPIQRKSVIGTLAYESGNYFVLAEDKKYKVLFASVTYYKSKPGDRVSITLPKDHESKWAALESVLHDHQKAGAREKENVPKLELPKENIDILESVKDEIFAEEKKRAERNLETPDIPQAAKETNSKTKEAAVEIPPDYIEKKESRVRVERPEEVEDTEKKTIVKDKEADKSDEFADRVTSMDGPGDFVQAEKDTNALGEKVEGKDDDGGIQELEI